MKVYYQQHRWPSMPTIRVADDQGNEVRGVADVVDVEVTMPLDDPFRLHRISRTVFLRTVTLSMHPRTLHQFVVGPDESHPLDEPRWEDPIC